MPWIIIIHVIYTIYITSIDTIGRNGMHKVNEKIHCALIGKESSLTTKEIRKT